MTVIGARTDHQRHDDPLGEQDWGGFHLGVDVTYLVTKRFGVGGLLRYTHGSVSLEGASDALTVGGFQIGVGGRLRF